MQYERPISNLDISRRKSTDTNLHAASWPLGTTRSGFGSLEILTPVSAQSHSMRDTKLRLHSRILPATS